MYAQARVVVALILCILVTKLHAIDDLQAPIVSSSNPHPLLEPGVCTLGATLECNNDGKSVGMFDVAMLGSDINLVTSSVSPTAKFGSSIKLVNKADPKKALYIGYVSGNRQSQIFKGHASVECYLCHGSAAQDPNERANPCPNSLDENYCVTCSPEKIPCNQVISLTRAQKKGAEARAQETTSLINRLGLAQGK